MSSSTDDRPSEIQICLSNLNQLNKYHMNVLKDSWKQIYGVNDKNSCTRLRELEDNLKQFWESQCEIYEDRQRSLASSIKCLGKKVYNLEKALGLPSKFSGVREDTPLVEMEEMLWELAEQYEVLKEKQISKYRELQEKEKELCAVLEQEPTLKELNSDSSEGATSSTKDSHVEVAVPTNDVIANAEERVACLQTLQEDLIRKFIMAKEELRQLLEECEVSPLSRVERFACDIQIDGDQNNVFICSAKNYQTLKAAVTKYSELKYNLTMECNDLRQKISNLWTKMMKSQEELDDFFNQHKGIKKSMLTKLQLKLQDLVQERKDNMKEIILKQRITLDELWTSCKFTDDQRSQFRPYNTTHYSEEVLELHELEVERLQHYYNKNKRIFQAAEKYFELWQRLLHLEDLAKRSDRLFKNRGGQLLLEEKERKLVQKKLPAIKRELVSLLDTYRKEEKHEFIYLGQPLIDKLEELEEQRQASKENEKLHRKAAHGEPLTQQETKLGVQPGGSCKRKILTPHNQNVSTKMLKLSSTASSTKSVASASGKSVPQQKQVLTQEVEYRRRRHHSPSHNETYALMQPGRIFPATSTPQNGSPTYESFQEHIETMKKDECLSSTKAAQRHPHSKRLPQALYKSPKTPSKSKIPFRIATGSKIPSVVPPISPKSGSKPKTPRKQLPIIF